MSAARSTFMTAPSGSSIGIPLLLSPGTVPFRLRCAHVSGNQRPPPQHRQSTRISLMARVTGDVVESLHFQDGCSGLFGNYSGVQAEG